MGAAHCLPRRARSSHGAQPRARSRRCGRTTRARARGGARGRVGTWSGAENRSLVRAPDGARLRASLQRARRRLGQRRRGDCAPAPPLVRVIGRRARILQSLRGYDLFVPTGGEGMEEREPTEQRIANKPGDDEAREKGEWAATAQEGIVPAEQGGSDAPPSLQPDDPELGSEGTGRPADSEASEIDLEAGDSADAVRDGGPSVPEGVEPDLKDATGGPRQVDADSAA